jgi:hypothetical protein
MKRYKLLIILFSLFAFCFSLTTKLFAENVQFTASAKTPVTVGEQFYLTYSVNANASAFKAPSFKDFYVIQGPSQSSSTSMQWVNGQMSQSVALTYTYVLQATKEGTFTIPPATVTIDGKSHQSNSLTITVGKATPGQQSQQQSQNRNQPGQSSKTSTVSGDDIFIRTIISKTSAYKGEPILVIQKIYTRVNIAGFEDVKMPSYKGFWSEEIKMPGQISLRRENYNGSIYNVAELKKTIIIPQQSGKLQIDAAEITCIAQVPSKNQSNNIWNFFGPSYQNVKYRVVSKSVSVDVKNLPTQNQPADFNGAVGNFSLKSDIDKTSVKTNDAVNLQFTISGSGNLKLIDKVNVDFPTDFETYDPKITSNINTSESGVSGSKKFEYLIIPRNPGKFKIKPVTLTYFDISSKTYKTLTTPEYTINVEKGTGEAANVTYRSANQEDVKFIGSDIRFIKNQPFILTKIGSFFFNSTLFYILLLLPFILFIIFLIIYRRTLKQRSNIAAMRNRKATKVARKRLKVAEKTLHATSLPNYKETFYIEISKALWGYTSDKFTIPIAELSMDTVNIFLSQKGVSEEIIQKIVDTLNNCEYARFAPGDSTSAMNNIYSEAIATIELIESQLK